MVGVRLLTDGVVGHRQARGGGQNDPCGPELALEILIYDRVFSLIYIQMNI